MNKTTVLLAEDHAIVRHGLRMMLNAESGFHVVGEAEDGVQALKAIENLKPDVVVIDLAMPKLGGLEVTKQAIKRFPSTKVVILSMYTDEAHVAEALQVGAKAYVFKSCSPDELVTAIKEAAAGHSYLSSPLTDRAIQAYVNAAQASIMSAPEMLSDREREILKLAAEGYTTPQIADILTISRRTVQTHRRNLMSKLNIHTQTELVLYAIRNGIVTSHK